MEFNMAAPATFLATQDLLNRTSAYILACNYQKALGADLFGEL